MALRITLDTSETVNVALHRPATQSSVSQWSVPNESARAVSGNRSGSFSFHTQFENNPWWQVDLESAFPIDAIVVWNRVDDCQERSGKLQIQVSLDGMDWQPVHRGIAYFGSDLTSRPLVHWLDGRLTARYVKLTLEANNALHLDAVEVLVSNNYFAAQQFWQRLERERPASEPPMRNREAYRGVVPRGALSSPRMDIDALEIVPFNRFGNNFHQLLNAAVLAPKMGIRDILFPQSFTRGASAGCTLAGLRFLHQADPSVGRALSGHYFWIEPFEHLFAQVSPRQMFDTLTNCIQPLYNGLISRAVPAHDEYVMHFHFRSGDIFRSAKTHGSYVQPPLSYFRAALRHAVEQYGVRRAVLVYEDTGNPCVLAFKNYLESIAFEHCVQSASLEEDICELLRARIICYGLATFVESILCLSSHARVAYAFRDPEFGAGLNKPRGCGIREMLLLKGMTLHVGTDTGSGYISKDGWMNTAQQRELMLNYPEDALKLATL